ncbi:hypothetical protein ACIQC5_17445 [Paenarthrobacter sp. NPDC092416]|uniref:hypothetical protein n=1 Tax=Paenarthrobacter sp. NPDC092416 TaxID=3364386 RepID=UPI00382AFDE6
MPDQISDQSFNAGTASLTSDALAGDVVRRAAEALSQTRSVVAVREQFNPMAVGLRSIWPASVAGF